MMRRSLLPCVLALALEALALEAVGCSKPKPVELAPRSVQVSAVKADGVQLALVLSVHNPNPFPILVNSVKASFELQDGTALGNAESASALSIPAKGDQDVAAQLDVHFSSLSALTPYALSGQALPYRVCGTARLGSEHLNLDLPFTIDGVLTPQQLAFAAMRGAQRFFSPPAH